MSALRMAHISAVFVVGYFLSAIAPFAKANSELNLACSIQHATRGQDSDPIISISVIIRPTEFDIIHHSKAGASYNRTDQYQVLQFGWKGKTFSWRGRLFKNANQIMVGELNALNGAYRYVEKMFVQTRPGKVAWFMESACAPSSLLGSAEFTAQYTWPDYELGRKNPERSIAACTQILESGPASRRSEAFYNLGSAYFGNGDLDQAISYLNESIRLGPPLTHRFQERGEVLLEKGDFGRAVADFNEAIRLDSTRAFRFHWRGRAYVGLGKLPLAIADFSEAIRLDPVKRSFRFYDRANALREAEQYAPAIQDYDEVLQLDPTNGWAFLDRGRTYKKMGQIVSARDDFEAALRAPDVKPELRAAVAEEVADLVPPPPPPPPPPDLRSQILSTLSNIRSNIEQRLPAIHFPALRRQADEVLAKLASANRDTSLEELNNLSRRADEIVKKIKEMDEFDSISSIAKRQKERIKDAIRNVVTDAPYLEEIQDAIAMLENSQQSDSLPALQSALGNLNRVYERYQTQIKRDTPDIP